MYEGQDVFSKEIEEAMEKNVQTSRTHQRAKVRAIYTDNKGNLYPTSRKHIACLPWEQFQNIIDQRALDKKKRDDTFVTRFHDGALSDREDKEEIVQDLPQGIKNARRVHMYQVKGEFKAFFALTTFNKV